MATQQVEYEAPMISPQNRDIEKQALSTVAQANGLKVLTVADRRLAAELGRIIAGLCKEAQAFFAPMKEHAFKAHREICDKEKSILEPLEVAKRYLSSQIGAFDLEAEKQRRVEEARLQEQQRQIAHAEAKRIADEQAIADAIALEAEGDSKGAEAVLNNPVPVAVHVPAVVLQSSVPKSAGVSGVKNFKFRITNEADIPREYLMVDEKKIGGVVRAMKDKTNIPGIEVYPEGGARFKA